MSSFLAGATVFFTLGFLGAVFFAVAFLGDAFFAGFEAFLGASFFSSFLLGFHHAPVDTFAGFFGTASSFLDSAFLFTIISLNRHNTTAYQFSLYLLWFSQGDTIISLWQNQLSYLP